MNTDRIKSLVNVAMMAMKCVVLVGCGGGANFARNLLRFGLPRIKLIDKDSVGEENVCRQEHMVDHLGVPKVDALAPELKRINPDARVDVWHRDFCGFTDAEIDREFGDADLFLFCVDNHPPMARGNEVALRLQKPAVWSGLYPQGRAGEVVFWKPTLRSCYRCCCGARYKAWEDGLAAAAPSDAADILGSQWLDAIAAAVAIGLLTEGEDNRYGRLIGQLGDRNFIQTKLDPTWKWNGRDVFREQLGVPDGNDAYFNWCTIARRDPDPGGNCPDCLRFGRPDL